MEKALVKFKTLDWSKWFNNTMVFLAPLGIIYLGMVYVNVDSNGFQTTDFIPTNTVIGAMVLYVINVLLDFFKKYKKAEVK